ncbi:hypothetical protein K0M31_014708 [Melipona bicolor]|uniref:Uncharacterized protein n=1 Tax=Melipona bicolor TaxID=60889 RepID=A0AA40KFW4_9HYME|nr:hypothetical protein K0M31_014708 [Melipona bicolor]
MKHFAPLAYPRSSSRPPELDEEEEEEEEKKDWKSSRAKAGSLIVVRQSRLESRRWMKRVATKGVSSRRISYPTLHIKRSSVPPHSPDIKYSVPDRQRWHVTHELHAVAYADDWPPTVKLIPRAPIPDPSSFVSAPFRAPVVCRWHASAHTSPSRTSVVKHFDFAQFDDFSPHRARRPDPTRPCASRVSRQKLIMSPPRILIIA